ncbi:MAG: hypothetical protein ACOY45_13620 [Pseudomonadota bacterium]
MRPLLRMLAALLLAPVVGSAVAQAPVRTVAAGAFLRWHPADGTLRFAAEGTVVTVESRRCRAEETSDVCYFGNGIYNSAYLTIAPAGLPPFKAEVNEAAGTYRIAIVRLNRADARPGLVVETDPNGSGGGQTYTIFAPRGDGYARVMLGYTDDPRRGGRPGTDFRSFLKDYPRDLDGDGNVDFVLRDGRFQGSPWGCHACEALPPMVLTLRDGKPVDISAEPAFAPLFEADLKRVRAQCLARRPDTEPDCVAYLADAARLGRFGAAWRDVTARQARHRFAMVWQGCTVPIPERYPRTCPAGRETHYRSFSESARGFLASARYFDSPVTRARHATRGGAR